MHVVQTWSTFMATFSPGIFTECETTTGGHRIGKAGLLSYTVPGASGGFKWGGGGRPLLAQFVFKKSRLFRVKA